LYRFEELGAGAGKEHQAVGGALHFALQVGLNASHVTLEAFALDRLLRQAVETLRQHLPREGVVVVPAVLVRS
jgi:hypothetical protein